MSTGNITYPQSYQHIRRHTSISAGKPTYPQAFRACGYVWFDFRCLRICLIYFQGLRTPYPRIKFACGHLSAYLMDLRIHVCVLNSPADSLVSSTSPADRLHGQCNACGYAEVETLYLSAGDFYLSAGDFYLSAGIRWYPQGVNWVSAGIRV